MKEDFSNNKLEKRLKAAAEQLTVLPSDRVWAGISDQLHPRRKRRYWLWAAAAILALSMGFYLVLHQNKKHINNHGHAAISPKIQEKGTPLSLTDKNDEENSDFSVHTPDKILPESRRKKDTRGEKGTTPNNFKGIIASSVPVEAKPTGEKLPFPPYRLPFLSSPGMVLSAVQSPADRAAAPVRVINSNAKVSSANSMINAPLPDQKAIAGKNKKRHISYEAFLVSGLGYRFLNVQSENINSDQMAYPGNQQMVNSLRPTAIVPQKEEMKHQPGISYSAGVNVAFPFGSHYTIKTGLSVMSLGYNITAFETYPAHIREDGSTSLSGYTGANSFYSQNRTASAVQRSKISNRYLYGEIPLLVSREFGSPEKVHLQVGLGGGLLYLLKSTPVIYFPKSGRYFTDKNLIRQLNANFYVEGEMIVPLSEKLNFTIGPSLQYQILSSYKNYPGVAERPYFPGIKAGLQWKK